MKNLHQHAQGTAEGRRGAILVAVTIVVAALATLSLTMVMRTEASSSEGRAQREVQAARLVAEAGINRAYMALNNGGDGNLGSADQPIDMGGSSYWVEVTDLGGGQVNMEARGTALGGEVRCELVMKEVEVASSVFGVFGDDWLQLTSNAFVDSYDSTAGLYAGQAVNTDGNDVWANEKGHIASNGSISLDQNSGVHGNATPGKTSSVTLEGTASVSGLTTPASDEWVMPPLVMPPGASTGPYTISGSQTLAAGTYHFDAMQVDTNSQLVITGPATLVVESLLLRANANLLIDSSAGPVEFFVATDFELESNALLAPLSKDPAGLQINLAADNIADPDIDVDFDENLEVGFKSNSKLYGQLFAPNAYIHIRSNFELFGSLVARRLHLSSNSMIHFDENLGASDEDTDIVYEIVGWREVTVHD